MTDQTLIIGLCIAGYCIVGYALSMWMYVINEHDDAETAAVFAALTFLFWPVGLSGLAGFGLLWLVTHPHRAAAALVQRMNTPAPIQEPGAFKRREEPAAVSTVTNPCDAYGQPIDIRANRLWLRSVAKEANSTGTVSPKPEPIVFTDQYGQTVEVRSGEVCMWPPNVRNS
jgi:hypothetical protein